MRKILFYPFILLGRLLLTIFLTGWVIYQIIMMGMMLILGFVFAPKSDDVKILKEHGGRFILHMIALVMLVWKEGLISTVENHFNQP